MDAIFSQLVTVIQQQQTLIDSIATKLQQIESIGGGGASISDYATNTLYKRNTLVVDPATETVYRVLSEYTSVSFATDLASGKLKLVGVESQVVTFSHNPTQTEINTLPDDTLVAVYSTTDTPYVPATE